MTENAVNPTELVTQGDKKILFFRLAKERATKSASKLALQVTHNIKEDKKSETTQTKDGGVVSGGGVEATMDIEALASTTEIVDMLHYAFQKNETLEVWEVNFADKKTNGKYASKYATGLLTSWEDSAETGANATIKTTFKANGLFVKGNATVTQADEAEALAFFYDLAQGASSAEPIPEYTPTTGGA